MNNKEKVVFKGLNFCQALTLLFIAAKILGYIPWSWLLVFSPVIIDIGSTLIAVIVVGTIEYFANLPKFKMR